MPPPSYNVVPITNATVIGYQSIIVAIKFTSGLPPNNANQYPILYIGDGTTGNSGTHFDVTYGPALGGGGGFGFNVQGWSAAAGAAQGPNTYQTGLNTTDTYIFVISFNLAYPGLQLYFYTNTTGFSGFSPYNDIAPINNIIVGYSPSYVGSTPAFTLVQAAYYTGSNFLLATTNIAPLLATSNTPNTIPGGLTGYSPYTFGTTSDYESVVFNTLGSPDFTQSAGVVFNAGSSDGLLLAAYLQPASVCFLEGARILTDRGEVVVEDLRVGDRVKTFRSGYLPVTAVGTSRMFNGGYPERLREQLYLYPESGLVVTGGHSVLLDTVNGELLARMRSSFGDVFYTEGRFRLMAMDDLHAIPYPVRGTFSIYNFALSDDNRNYGVYANGQLVECSFPSWIYTMKQVLETRVPTPMLTA